MSSASRRHWAGGFFDAAFQANRIFRQLGIGCRQEVGVKATVLFDGSDGPGRELKAYGLAQRIGQKGGLLNIRQEPTARFIVGMAYVIACQYTLTGYATASGHDPGPKFVPTRY